MTAPVLDPAPVPSTDRELAGAGAVRIFTRLPVVVAGALLAVVLYAAFDHGAVGLAPAARVEVLVGVIAAVAAVAWLGCDALDLRASPATWLGIVLLGSFVCWSGLSVLWSVSPDQTWLELNRGLMYVVVLVLGVALGSTQPRMPALLARGFLVLAVAVALYALGQKLVPGLHVTGLFDLNQTGSIPRLQEPIGYWNALALFLVLAVPGALELTIDPTRTPRWRLVAATALALLFLTIGLTLSRGGLLALVVALVVVMLGADRRLLALVWLALALAATLPALVLGLTLHSLARPGVPLGSREVGGAILAAVLVASLAALYAAGTAMLRYEPRLRHAPEPERQARRLSLAGLAGLVVAGLLAATFTHAWHNFTSPTAPANFSPSRLLSTDSYRWLWWKEAAHAFGARPLRGWGAGSFGVIHLIYRQNTLPVQQPHSVPLQFLSETGALGALLGLGGLAVLLTVAARSASRRELSPGQRRAAMALLGAVAAYLMHFLYDWDWDIPALTLPTLLFMGVLVGAQRSPLSTHGGRSRQGLSLGTRTLAITGATLWLCLYVVSAILPSLAASDSGAALVEASSSSRAGLAAAETKARRASSLDPLSDAGPRAEASIALHRGQSTRARYDLERAVAREPSDEPAWDELAVVDGFLGDRAGVRQAARRVLALDPQGTDARAVRKSNLAAYGR